MSSGPQHTHAINPSDFSETDSGHPRPQPKGGPWLLWAWGQLLCPAHILSISLPPHSNATGNGRHRKKQTLSKRHQRRVFPWRTCTMLLLNLQARHIIWRVFNPPVGSEAKVLNALPLSKKIKFGRGRLAARDGACEGGGGGVRIHVGRA